MSETPYYMAYEKRYKTVYEAGVERWGHPPDDDVLVETLIAWVTKNNLKGKRVVEFACGEGASGVILSELGCLYKGFDISPTAVEKARATLSGSENASVSILDMVNNRVDSKFDAALDCMGFHMLVTDPDREKYLNNAYECLIPGAPMLFFRQLHKADAFNGFVETFDEWVKVSGSDYNTPRKLNAKSTGGEDIEINIPLVPGRAKTKEGYVTEMEKAGFTVEDFTEMDINQQNPYSASIYVRKP